jgi:outer membrane protein TolC
MKKRFFLMIALLLISAVVRVTVIYAGGAQEEDPEKQQRTEQRREEKTRIEIKKVENETRPERPTDALIDEGTLALDVDGVVDFALANNLGIVSEKLALSIKKRARDTVFNKFYPTARVSGTLSRMHEEPDDIEFLAPVDPEDMEDYGLYDYMTENPYAPGTYTYVDPDYIPDGLYGTVTQVTQEVDHTWNVSAKLDFNLTLSAALFWGIRAAVLDYQSGRLGLETTRKKLARDVKKQFYNLLLMEENIALMQKKIDTARERYEQAKVNYENGLVSEYTMLSAQVALENLKPGLESMKTGYRSALLGFKHQLGMPLDTELTLDGKIEPETLDLESNALKNGFMANRLDIQSLVQQIEIIRNSRDATIAGMTPSVTFLLNFDTNFMNDPFEDDWFEDTDEDWVQRNGMFAVTLAISLDQLLPFSQSWVSIADSNNRIKQMQTNLTQAIRGAEMEIENIIMNLKKSADAVETLEMNVQLAERAYNMAEEAYNAGTKELLEVKEAEDELNNARVKVLEEKYSYTTGLLDLEYALNTTMKEIRDRYYE